VRIVGEVRSIPPEQSPFPGVESKDLIPGVVRYMTPSFTIGGDW
jgi:hypothetical protein